MGFADKIKNLPPNIQEFLASNESRIAKERACFLYDLQEEDVAEITPITRGIYLGEVPLEDLPLNIASSLGIDSAIAYGIAYEIAERTYARFPEYFKKAPELLDKWKRSKLSALISEEKAWRRVLDIEPWIEEEEKERARQAAQEAEKARRENARLERLSLAEGMQKYPQLGEQAITSNPITLKYFDSPVRPSIKNWISDYQDTVGTGDRSAVQRSSYLFSSTNAKRLTGAERERLGALLRSLDEKSPLPIYSDTGKISFEAIAKENKASQAETRGGLRATVIKDAPRGAADAPGALSRGVYEEPEDIFARYSSRVGRFSMPAAPDSQKAAQNVPKKPLASARRPEVAPQRNIPPVFSPKANNLQGEVAAPDPKGASHPFRISPRPQAAANPLEAARKRITDAAQKMAAPIGKSAVPQNLPFSEEGEWQIRPSALQARPEGMARMSEMGAGKIGMGGLRNQETAFSPKPQEKNPLQQFGAERISSLAKEGARKEEYEEGAVRFSSPQTLPVEKRVRADAQTISAVKFDFDAGAMPRRNRPLDKPFREDQQSPAKTPQPMRITPHAFMRDAENQSQAVPAAAPRIDGNVVDLKNPQQ